MNPPKEAKAPSIKNKKMRLRYETKNLMKNNEAVLEKTETSRNFIHRNPTSQKPSPTCPQHILYRQPCKQHQDFSRDDDESPDDFSDHDFDPLDNTFYLRKSDGCTKHNTHVDILSEAEWK